MPVCPTEKSHVPAILTIKNCSHLWIKAATVCICFHTEYTSLRQKIILFLSFICVSKVSKQSHEHHKFRFLQINSPKNPSMQADKPEEQAAHPRTPGRSLQTPIHSFVTSGELIQLLPSAICLPLNTSRTHPASTQMLCLLKKAGWKLLPNFLHFIPSTPPLKHKPSGQLLAIHKHTSQGHL